MFTMCALLWSPAAESELLVQGFTPHEVYVRYPGFPVTNVAVDRAVREMLCGDLLHESDTPYQFAVALYREKNKKVGVVQVAITLRKGTEPSLVRNGFQKAVVLGKHGSYLPTMDAILKDEQEFHSMRHQPDRWYADSYWGAGAD